MALSRSLQLIIVVIVIVILVGGILILYDPGAGNGNLPPDEAFHVSITGSLTFDPSEITIHVGDNVTWTNNAGIVHTVVSDVGSAETFASGTMSSGETFTHQFNSVGVFPYHCSIHPTMTGTVTVIE